MEVKKFLRELENTRQKSETGWYVTSYSFYLSEKVESVHISLARYIKTKYQVDRIVIESDTEVENLEEKILRKLEKFGIRMGGTDDSGRKNKNKQKKR